MATQWQTFPIEFKGGLISNLSPLQQGANALGSATTLQNFEVTKEGGYKKIKGFSKFSAIEVPGSNEVLALSVIGSGRIVVARKNASNVTEYYVGTGTSWVSLSSSASLMLGTKVRHIMYNTSGDDKVVFVDSVNYPVVYNTSGDTFSVISNAAVLGASQVAFFANTGFYAKGSELIFAAPGTVDDFDPANAAGSLKMRSDIVGLAVFRDQLIVFGTDSIQRLTGSTGSDFNLSVITDRMGCLNGDTIQEVGGDIMYLAADGVRLLSATDRIGDFGLDVTSDSIAKDAATFKASASNFCSVLFRAKAQYRVFSYVESEQSVTAKGLIATKYVSQGASGISWSTSFGIKAFVADSIYSGNTETAAFANDDGYIYILDDGNSFDGNAIDAIYESPYMPITDPQVRKSFYKMTIYAEPTGSMAFEVSLKYDFGAKTNTGLIQPPPQVVSSTGIAVFLFGTTAATYGTATFGGELDTVYDTHVTGSGKTVSIRIEDKTTNPAFTLDTALLEFSQEDRQ
tara:strand:- start:3736 stop:5277 length:1542 start_codon:yes stop_codon:yes gene_type:complete